MRPWAPAPRPPAEPPADGAEGEIRPDLRLLPVAAGGWAGGAAVLLGVGWILLTALGLGAVSLWLGRLRGRPGRGGTVLLGVVLAAAAVAGTAFLGTASRQSSPLARLADAEAAVTVTARVASDPVRRPGTFAPVVLVRLVTTRTSGLGRVFRVRTPVLLIGDEAWSRVRLGQVVEVSGRLRPARDTSEAAVVLARAGPVVRAAPGPGWRAAEAVRQGIRDATARGSAEARALVPALVVGDDQTMSPQVVEDFRTTGLTHLAAVSGTNLTLVVGSLLMLARAVGVRARGLVVVGAAGVLGFVLLARTEPSVVRAAAMGSVALLGMGVHGRRQGARALGLAVLVLLLWDPWLTLSWGFALSVTATAGILFLAPGWRDRLMVWAPRWVAEALAVPLAAQLACTPAVAALSGQVSLVAVLANLAVAPAVAPATVLGLLGGLLHLVVPWLGTLVGSLATVCGWWIVAVAVELARLPGAATPWPADPWRLALLVGLCVLVAAGSTLVLGRRGATLATVMVLLLALVVPRSGQGWPPADWVVVACDVGQGDALVFPAGPGRAVVVDTGPDPVAIDRCLRRLGVTSVPLLVLTHFHADHVDGLPGVLRGRTVGEIWATGLAEPTYGAAAVAAWARGADVGIRVPTWGEQGAVGPVRWQVVGPARAVPSSGSGSPPNDASLVLLVESGGVRVLAAGDIEGPGQAMLRRTVPDLRADVLKVPHHGSADQDEALVRSLGARVAVVSVGEDNRYGHPARSTLTLLEQTGMVLGRTDLDGDVAVTRGAEGLELRTARRSPSKSDR